jgi:hypothetical protein
LNSISLSDTFQVQDSIVKKDTAYIGVDFSFSFLPGGILYQGWKKGFSQEVPVKLSTFIMESCLWYKGKNNPFLFSFAPIGFDIGKGRKSISPIQGYPAFSEMELKVFSIKFGGSILFSFKKKFLFQSTILVKMGLIGIYSLRVKVLRGKQEVILYDRTSKETPMSLGVAFSIGYSSYLGIFFVDIGIQDYLFRDPYSYSAPVEIHNKARPTFPGIYIGIRLKKTFYEWIYFTNKNK